MSDEELVNRIKRLEQKVRVLYREGDLRYWECSNCGHGFEGRPFAVDTNEAHVALGDNDICEQCYLHTKKMFERVVVLEDEGE